MISFKRLAFRVAIVAIVAAVCINWSAAQKSPANSFQQQIGSNQQSVYGGYQSGSSSVQKGTSWSSASLNNQRPRQPTAQRPVYQQQQQQTSYQQQSSYEQDQQAEADAEPASYGSVNGQPGVDFPAYTRVPKTSFSCDGLPYDYGMYADEETGCQAYHVCYNGRKDSFLCGVGTVFNQRILHCDYWYSVDCGKSSQYYSSNAYMGSSQPEPGPAQASGSYQQSGSSYSRRVEASSNLRPATIQKPKTSYQTSSLSKNTQQVQEEY